MSLQQLDSRPGGAPARVDPRTGTDINAGKSTGPTGQFHWPPAGTFTATTGQDLMAADSRRGSHPPLISTDHEQERSLPSAAPTNALPIINQALQIALGRSSPWRLVSHISFTRVTCPDAPEPAGDGQSRRRRSQLTAGSTRIDGEGETNRAGQRHTADARATRLPEFTATKTSTPASGISVRAPARQSPQAPSTRTALQPHPADRVFHGRATTSGTGH